MSLEEKPVSVGPWGGSGGYSWDDGVYSTIRQLVIVHGEGIDSIQIEYDKEGDSVWSLKHGGSGGHKIEKIKLDYPNEFLTSVDGYYGSLNQWGPIFIRSISFESNKKLYGPFGVEQGTYFTLPVTGAKIVGFHGRYGWHIDAIGVHLRSYQQPKPSKTLSNSHNHINNTNDSVGYSVIQGSVSQGFDIVVAVKQKDGFSSKTSPTNKILTFKEPNSIEPKEKIVPMVKAPSIVDDGVVTYGPWGGNGGYVFDDGPYTGIRQIDLSRNIGIVWIRVLYDLDGEAVWGHKYGGAGGFKHEKMIFDFPNEVLTHISGYYGSLMYMGPSIIRSLTFHTTKRTYGPFGDEYGTYFTTKLKEGKVVGIHGRKGLFLDALGVHVIEGKVIVSVPTSPSMEIIPREPSITEIKSAQWPTKPVLSKPAPLEEVPSGVIKEPAPCGPGPWGGDGGRPWDDGVFSDIKQIYLTKSPEGICSIQIEYDRNKQSVWSVKHGGNGGSITHRIKLEYPNEVLSCITGYHGTVATDEQAIVIKSLTFHTSRGKYGPFGDEVGKFFTSTKTEGKVVGFHGRSSMYLDAIGVHMQHWLGSQKTSSLSQSGVRLVRGIVKDVKAQKIILNDGTEVPYGLLVWSTGVGPSPIIQSLDLPKAPGGRIGVDEWLRVPSVQDVFSIGDCSGFVESTGRQTLPALAQVAERQGKYLASMLNKIGKEGAGHANSAKEIELGDPFVYKHLGSMATIGRYKALVDLRQSKEGKGLALAGVLSFFIWRSAYITRVVSWRNRFYVFINWITTLIFGRDISRL